MTSKLEINTIEELFNNITSDMELDDINNILKKYNGNDWKNLIVFDKETYCKKVLFSNELCDIVIIGWSPNQNAPKHDHAKLGCSLLILQGGLIENIYDTQGENLIKTNNVKKGEISCITNNIGIHSINNTNLETVSLHIYRPPNHKTKYY